MPSWFKIALPAAALVVAAGLTGAGATAGASPTASTHAQVVQPPATRAAQAVTPDALVDSTTESKYTPIAPCRIVDTRIAGGAIAKNATRSFHALGAGSFAGQGGASCDIPSSATAVTGSIIATGATGSGYLKVYGYGAAEPTPSFLNYVSSPTLSASGTIPVSNSTYDFTVKAFTHPTQVVIQLTGYYVRPMWVEVSSAGGVVQGSRVTTISHIGTGSYEVDFDRNVSACAFIATSYFYGTTMEVEPRSGNVNGVFVAASDYNGNGVDTYFYLTVTC